MATSGAQAQQQTAPQQLPFQRGTIASVVRQRKRNVVKALEPKVFVAAVEKHFELAGSSGFEAVQTALINDRTLDFHTYDMYFVDLIISGGVGLCQGRPDQAATPFSKSVLNIEEDHFSDFLNLIDFVMRRLRVLGPALNNALRNTMRFLNNPVITAIEGGQERLAKLIAMLVCAEHIQLGGSGMALADEDGDRLGAMDDLDDPEEEEVQIVQVTTGIIPADSLISPLLTPSLVESGTAFSFFAMMSRAIAEMSDTKNALHILVGANILPVLPSLLSPTQRVDAQEETAVCSALGDSQLDWLCAPYLESVAIQRKAAIARRIQNMISSNGVFRSPDGSDGDEWKEVADSVVAEISRTIEELCINASKVDNCLLVLDTIFVADSSMSIQDFHRALFRWSPLLRHFVNSSSEPELQGDLLLGFQSLCFNSPRAIDFFGEFVADLYGFRVLCEDVITTWTQLSIGSGFQFFKTQLKGFIAWLSATQEDDGED